MIKVIFGAGTTGRSANNEFLAKQSTSSIAGTVYDDADGSGTLTAGDSAKGGVTVFLDTDDDGNLDAGETSTTASSIAGSEWAPTRSPAWQPARTR